MPVRITNLSKTGVILFNQGREDLIFSVTFTLEAMKTKTRPKQETVNKEENGTETSHQEGAEQAPGSEPAEKAKPEQTPPEAEIKELAWIVPVPSMPASFGQVDAQCFSELDDLIPIYRLERTGGWGFGGGGGGEQKPTRSLLVYPARISGDYLIQPLRATGKEGVQALKAWLDQHDFTPMSERAMSYYAANNWTFLAIKVRTKGLAAGKSQTLNPLRISFPTNRLVFPMKMAEGTVSATLFVLSDVQLPHPAQILSNFGFEFQGAKAIAREGLRQKKILDLWKQSGLRNGTEAYLYRYQANAITPSSFSTDVIFP